MEKGNLIITRRIGESLIIGEDEIEVSVIGIKGNQVRLSIRADKSTSVHRSEIYDRIKREQHGINNDDNGGNC